MEFEYDIEEEKKKWAGDGTWTETMIKQLTGERKQLSEGDDDE